VSASAHGELTTLATGFGFTEGPAVDRHGNVFFTDQPNDRIYRWDAGTGETTLFLQGTGRANGMAFDRDGNLIAMADMHTAAAANAAIIHPRRSQRFGRSIATKAKFGRNCWANRSGAAYQG